MVDTVKACCSHVHQAHLKVVSPPSKVVLFVFLLMMNLITDSV